MWIAPNKAVCFVIFIYYSESLQVHSIHCCDKLNHSLIITGILGAFTTPAPAICASATNMSTCGSPCIWQYNLNQGISSTIGPIMGTCRNQICSDFMNPSFCSANSSCASLGSTDTNDFICFVNGMLRFQYSFLFPVIIICLRHNTNLLKLAVFQHVWKILKRLLLVCRG